MPEDPLQLPEWNTLACTQYAIDHGYLCAFEFDDKAADGRRLIVSLVDRHSLEKYEGRGKTLNEAYVDALKQPGTLPAYAMSNDMADRAFEKAMEDANIL